MGPVNLPASHTGHPSGLGCHLTIVRRFGGEHHLHKHYGDSGLRPPSHVIGRVNAQQEEVLPPRRVELDDWPKWAQAHLNKSDVVVVEATTNTIVSPTGTKVDKTGLAN